MKSMSKIAAVLLFALMSISCATAKSKKKEKNTIKPTPAPKWVDSPTEVYPASKYFQAVGSGVSRANAELQAIHGIASVFGQNVKSSSNASKRMEQAIKDGKAAVTTTEGIAQDILTKVNLDDVVGVEIAGYWQNVEEGNYLAIAVMDKLKASAMYSSMIEQNDKEVRVLIDADEEDTLKYFTFETYARFDLAREIAEKNEGYLERLQVIDVPTAQRLREKIMPSKTIKSKELEIAKAIPIGIIVEGDKDNRIKTAFANAVSSTGFRTSGLDGERYMITASISFERHDTRDGKTVQCRYNADAPLRDTAADEVLLAYSASGREASKDWETAQYNTFKTLEKKIKSAYTKAFKEYTASIAAY